MAEAIDSMDAKAAPMLERCRASLAEKEAKRIPENLEPLGMGEQHSLVAGNASFWRCWSFASEAELSTFQDFLVKYTSAKNLTATAYVQDPQVQGETIHGKFRCVAVRRLKREGMLLIAQGLRRVYAPATVAELAALACRKTRANEFIQPLGLGPGEQDDVAWVFPDMDPAAETTLLGLADADLVTGLPGAGWTYVKRELVHGEDNGSELVIVFRKVAWTAFVYTTPDLAWYSNDGTLEDRELTQEWIGINQGDALANLYASDVTKFHVIRVKVTERGDGAIDIQRILVHEIYGALVGETPTPVQAVSQDTLNVHGLVAGTLDKILVINENLKAKTSAYTAVPSGYTLAQMREEKTPTGWNKYYLYSKATWGNTTPTWTQNAVLNPEGYDSGKESIAPGVPVASAAGMVAGASADTDHVLERVDFSERGNGEAVLLKRQMEVFDTGWKPNEAGGPVLIGWRNAVGRQPRADIYCWFHVSPALVLVVADAAQVLANYPDSHSADDGWAVGEVRIEWLGGGAGNVIGEVLIPIEATADPAPDPDDEEELWGAGTAGTYMLTEYIRDNDGLPIYYITYGVAEGRGGSEVSAINQINQAVAPGGEAYLSPFSSAAGKLLCRGTDWRRVKDWAYEWKAVWIEDEGVYV